MNHAKMKISDDICYIGVDDHKTDLFEGQYPIPNGMAYNSYVIRGEKTAVIDTVDIHFTEEWMNNLAEALGDRTPDYLIIQHMEPDHGANIAHFMEAYPNTAIVATAKAFAMIDQFFDLSPEVTRITAANKGTLSLGKHTLTFLFAPMVHWPEVMVTYDSADKVLFSADAFGKFGANDVEEPWEDEARRYYIGIVGKYGRPVQALLKAAAELDIETICATHGPVLKGNTNHYMSLYDTWSSYRPETEGVLIAYTSIYGHTKKAVELLESKLIEKGCPKVVVRDLARCDMSKAVEEAFRYSKLVLATTTYNGGIFPHMQDFITHLTERDFQNRTVAFVENGSWAPQAVKIMQRMLEKSKSLTYAENHVTIKSALKADSMEAAERLAEELCAESGNEE